MYKFAIIASIAFFAILGCTRPGDISSTQQSTSSFEEFKRSLPLSPVSKNFLVEGDMEMSESQLLAYYQKHIGPTRLIVHHDGFNHDVIWNDTDKVNLTYCFDASIASIKAFVIESFAQSEKQWENAANVNFIYVPGEDANCNYSNPNVKMIVSTSDLPSGTAASAILPDLNGSKVGITLDYPLYLSYANYNKIENSVDHITHEMGHTLGFLHEHAHPDAIAQGSTCYDNPSFNALSQYDIFSIMHYGDTSCNGLGTRDGRISYLDASSIQRLYGPASRPAVFITSPTKLFSWGYNSSSIVVAGKTLSALSISKVEVYVYDTNNNLVNTVQAVLSNDSSWFAEINNLNSLSSYTFEAIATDSSNNPSEPFYEKIHVNYQYNDHTISLTGASHLQQVSGTLSLQANLTSSLTNYLPTIAYFFLNGILVYSDSEAPFTYNLDTTLLQEGKNIITIRGIFMENGTSFPHHFGDKTIVVDVKNIGNAPIGSEYTDTAGAHSLAGRASFKSGGSGWGYYTVGGNEYIGNYLTQATICETSSGYFIAGSCPTGNQDTVAPVVKIIAPFTQSKIKGTSLLRSDARDNVGVTKVQFINTANSALLCEATAAPFDCQWDSSAQPAGPITIMAKAFDAAGNSGTSAPISIEVLDLNFPSVTLTTPANNSTLTGIITFSANASDNEGVKYVEFLVYRPANPSEWSGCSVSEAPYECQFNTTSLPDGPVNVFARVHDTADNYTDTAVFTYTIDNSSLDTEAPTITVTAPTNNSTISGLVTFKADATDNVGVTKVSFGMFPGLILCEATTAPFECNWDSTQLGNSTYGGFVAMAYDAAGNSTSVNMTYTIDNQAAPDTEAPSVSIITPANNASINGTVSFTSTSSDNTGVVKVSYSASGTGLLLCESTTAPFSCDWDSTPFQNINMTVFATATDAAGNSGQSATISLQIDNIPDPVSLTFNNDGNKDGYVKANFADGSGATLGTYSTLAIGQGSDGKENRAFLSFDTSSIPDTATITKAYVQIAYSSISGSPWTNNTLVVDVQTGYFGASGIQASDWLESATANAVATIDSFSSGIKNSADFSATGLAAINKTGQTELKLRFANAHTSTAYLFIKGAGDAKLFIEYQ